MKDLETEIQKELEIVLPDCVKQMEENAWKYQDVSVVKMCVLINGVADILHWDVKEGRFTKLVYTVGVKGGAFCEGGSGFYDEVEYRDLML
jgi:hypothetical protein